MTTAAELTRPKVTVHDLTGLQEVKLRSLAREIAMDIIELETILLNHGLTQEQFERIAARPMFLAMLREETEMWGSALNTKERVDIKTVSMVEMALPTMFGYLHDAAFGDNAKVEIFKALQRGAGLGQKDAVVSSGEKVSITINMGADKQLKIEREVTSGVTFDGEAEEISP